MIEVLASTFICLGDLRFSLSPGPTNEQTNKRTTYVKNHGTAQGIRDTGGGRDGGGYVFHDLLDMIATAFPVLLAARGACLFISQTARGGVGTVR